jgi:hypothetical protein
MYRLMKSEKFTLNHLTAGLISFYRQTRVKHFRQFRITVQTPSLRTMMGFAALYPSYRINKEL